MEGLEGITKVEVLSVQPDDVIILTCDPDTDMSGEDMLAAQATWRRVSGLPNKVVVMEGASIKVLSPGGNP